MSDEKKEIKSTEFPKSMHKGGDRAQLEKVVQNAAEEKEARADGFAMIDKQHEKESIARRAAEDKTAAESAAKAKGK